MSSPFPGTVRVTGDFIQGSTATGLLVVVYLQSDDSGVHYNDDSECNGQSMEMAVGGLIGGPYGVSVFVMDSRLPFSRVAALPQFLQLNTLNVQQSKCACDSLRNVAFSMALCM